jgi:phosphate transport system substrate-binding protein
MTILRERATLRQALAVVLLSLTVPSLAVAVDLIGAGATFPYPVYAKWAEAYKQKSGVTVNYQSIGSGGGIKQIQSNTVDFGATDMPLKPDELEKDGLTQFPTVIGGDVPVINVKGIKPGELKLTGAVLADIFLGKITKWNDPAIAGLNKGMALPDQAISVVHRADGSGTTFIWTNYLSKVSPEWKSKAGEDTSVEFPGGLGGKGNEGVAALTGRTDGAIGYVEYAYALQNKMTDVQLQNRHGEYVRANGETFKAAAAGADWSKAPGFYLILTDQAGQGAWPVSGATFILMHKVQAHPDKGSEVLKFFDWAYSDEGDKLASNLDYVPLPPAVIKQVTASWKDIKDGAGKPVR